MRSRQPVIEFYDGQSPSAGFMLYARRPLGSGLLDATEDEDVGAEAISDSDKSSATGVQVSLVDHLAHVEAKVLGFTHAAGLDAPLTELVALAARLHDLGKADPRFQADLYGKSALARLGFTGISFGPLLAKSARTGGIHPISGAAPALFRHEALSLAFATKHPAVIALDESERDLVLWLVGTHHGYGRPFFPPCFDQSTTESEVRSGSLILRARADEAPLKLDQGWFERAFRVNRRYGAWELARLEAILRLADHAASAEEAGGTSREEMTAATKAAAP